MSYYPGKNTLQPRNEHYPPIPGSYPVPCTKYVCSQPGTPNHAHPGTTTFAPRNYYTRTPELLHSHPGTTTCAPRNYYIRTPELLHSHPGTTTFAPRNYYIRTPELLHSHPGRCAVHIRTWRFLAVTTSPKLLSNFGAPFGKETRTP